MIAAVCGWHEHHARAATEIGRRLARRDRMLSAAPALVEGYAVLTRLPPPHRLAPADALALLDANFIRARRVLALDSRSYCDLLRRAPGEGVSGGRTYDAVIVACALRAKVTTLLTFNAEHFAPYSDRGLAIVVP